jgi:hypothetical protein
MSRWRRTAWLASSFVLAVVLGPGVAAGAPPVIERIPVDDTFADPFLSEACGVQVTVRARGHIIVRTFAGDRTGVAEVRTINVGLTATAGERVFRFRDVGADVTRIEPDGTAILSITGQVPFDFAGVLKIDLETGETILEPRDRSAEQVAKACAALTG